MVFSRFTQAEVPRLHSPKSWASKTGLMQRAYYILAKRARGNVDPGDHALT